MDLLKKLEKDGKMSQDDHRGNSDKVQELTDRLIKEVDATSSRKRLKFRKYDGFDVGAWRLRSLKRL